MSTYRWTAKPLKVGQLRFKTWRYAIAPMRNDPMWSQRAADYWQLQAETFGFKFDDVRFTVFPEFSVVETSCRVTEVLPGERVRNFRTDRVKAAERAAQ